MKALVGIRVLMYSARSSGRRASADDGRAAVLGYHCVAMLQTPIAVPYRTPYERPITAQRSVLHPLEQALDGDRAAGRARPVRQFPRPAS